MWHMFIMERIDQMENKQKPVERETRQLIQTYNVLLKSQIYAYFAKTQRDHFVGRAFKTLEKEKQIYIHQDLEMAAINEEAFKARNVGTLQAFWVLLDIMDQKDTSTSLHQKRNILFALCYAVKEKSMTFCMCQRMRYRLPTICLPGR